MNNVIIELPASLLVATGLSRAEFLLEMGRRGAPVIDLDAEERRPEVEDV